MAAISRLCIIYKINSLEGARCMAPGKGEKIDDVLNLALSIHFKKKEEEKYVNFVINVSRYWGEV